jgi:ATP-binding cassette, subfamily B, bacterial PglK
MMQSIKHDFIKIFRQIYAWLPPRRRRQFWVLVCGMGLLGVFETLTAAVVAVFISAVSNPDGLLKIGLSFQLPHFIMGLISQSIQGLIAGIAFVMVVIMALQVIARVLVGYYGSLYAGYVSAYLGERLLTSFLKVAYEWLMSQNAADLIQTIHLRVQVGHYIRAALKLLSDILVVGLMLAAVVGVAPGISLSLIMALALLSFIIFNRNHGFLDKISGQVKDYVLFINRQVYKAINGIKDIKVTGREALFIDHYYNSAYREARFIGLQDVLSQLPRWLLEFISLMLVAIAVTAMVFMMDAGSLKTTGLIALLAAVGWRALPALSRIIQGFSVLQVYLPYVRLILEYLDKTATHISGKGDQNGFASGKFDFQRQIAFDHVSFVYAGQDQQILNDLNFTVSHGETVGIIGVSGAGKSTLVDLIIGLLKPTKGDIIVDGHRLEADIVRSWMLNIGYVPQFPYICDGTIAENIAYGFIGDQIDRNRVMTCCHLAAMDDFVWGLPQGIDTWIGERGAKLSGGQQQRVAIARALYHQPEVMIFDEATSSLDTRSEKAIQQTIFSLKGSHTLIIIAHRLSTVEDCDNLIWLENGRVKKIGSPEGILPEYRQQMKAEKLQ